MNTYVVTLKATGAGVYRYDNDAPIELGGFEFATHNHTLLVVEDPPAEPQPPRRLTRLEFIARLTQEEFAGLLAASKTSIEVEAFIKLMDWVTPDPDGTSVDLDDARTVGGVRALFTPERADQILGVAHV